MEEVTELGFGVGASVQATQHQVEVLNTMMGLGMLHASHSLEVFVGYLWEIFNALFNN